MSSPFGGFIEITVNDTMLEVNVESVLKGLGEKALANGLTQESGPIKVKFASGQELFYTNIKKMMIGQKLTPKRVL